MVIGLVLQVRVGLGPGNGMLSFFSFSSSLNVMGIIGCALLACIVDVKRQYDIIGDEAW